jgi:hypothetical protein
LVELKSAEINFDWIISCDIYYNKNMIFFTQITYILTSYTLYCHARGVRGRGWKPPDFSNTETVSTSGIETVF